MRKLRLLLFPFAGLYYLITLLRNGLYDAGILKSKSYPIPIICIGNLSTGGTGKSPMTEYIIRLLKGEHSLATLSRGYGRNTNGYLEVSPEDLATQVGDEPLQFARKFKDVQVTVCEDRQEGIERLLSKPNAPEVIILDDAYQHRKVKAGFNMLLTTYNDLYINDFLLPAGNLREPRSGAKRAQVIVVTKCPSDISKEEQKNLRSKLKLRSNQSLLFSHINYDTTVYSNNASVSFNSLKAKKVTLVTGIANPKPLEDYLVKNGLTYSHLSFGDHHNFSASEIMRLDKLECILTTEKDYVRLRPALKMKQLYYLPIKVSFLNDERLIVERIKGFVDSF